MSENNSAGILKILEFFFDAHWPTFDAAKSGVFGVLRSQQIVFLIRWWGIDSAQKWLCKVLVR